MLGFYGLQPTDRISKHKEILDLLCCEICNFTFTEIYTLPVDIRRFYVSEIAAKIKVLEKNIKTNSPDNSKKEKPLAVTKYFNK